MICALLAGQKTMTRRLAWHPARVSMVECKHGFDACPECDKPQPTPWQRVKPGDRLWAREGWKPHSLYGDMKPRDMPKTKLFYLADNAYEPSNVKGRPSIHMPRWASRITIMVTATKIEPVQEISEEDADAEGIVTIPRSLTRHGRLDGYGAPGTLPDDASTTRVNGYRALWRKLHGTASWDENPEVVAMSGRVVVANIDSAETHHG